MATGSFMMLTGEASPAGDGGDFGVDYLFRNRDGDSSVFLGSSKVSPTLGFELLPGEALSLSLGPGEKIYGVTGGPNVRVDVLRLKERA